LSESDVCYIIIFFASESLLLLLEAGRRLSSERLIELRVEGRIVSISAFDDDLIAANKDSGGMPTHIYTIQHTKRSKLTLAETRVGAGAAWNSISANTAGFLMEGERFILMLMIDIVVVVVVIVWVL
jgi:hypothetical protein